MQRKRILVFGVNWLGDVLFSTPVMRSLKEAFPGSFVACLVPPRCVPLLQGNPSVDEILPFDERTSDRGPLRALRLVRALRRRRFDCVFLLHRSFTRALLSALAGIPQRVGFQAKNRSWLLTQPLEAPQIDAVHRIDYYLEVLSRAGVAVTARTPEIFVSDEEKTAARSFLQSRLVSAPGPLIGINPGGNWGPKRWPKESWALLARRLARECNARIVISGGAQDQRLAREIAGGISPAPVIACGELSLRIFIAMTTLLDCLVSADSGPLHIANAAGARALVGLFGPTDPRLTGPRPAQRVKIIRAPVDCALPCYRVDCPDNRCMRSICVDRVFEAVKGSVEY